MLDDLWLVGDLRNLDADRKLERDRMHRILQIFSQRDDVRSVLHGDAETDCGLSARADDEARRVLVAPPDRCDVAQAEYLALRLHRHGSDCLHARKGTGHPQVDAVRRGIHRTAGDHGILPADAVEDLLRREAERRELGVAEFNEDALWPLADDIYLVDIGYAEQPLTDVLCARLEICEREAVGTEHVQGRIHIAVFVVEVRAVNSGRQRATDVADLLADLIP